jgi:hypothetical protein
MAIASNESFRLANPRPSSPTPGSARQSWIAEFEVFLHRASAAPRPGSGGSWSGPALRLSSSSSRERPALAGLEMAASSR